MSSSEMSVRSVVVERGSYPVDGPVIWAAAAAFEAAGWNTGPDNPQAVIAYGSGCEAAGGLPGVYLAPPIADPRVFDSLCSITGPLLVVGTMLDPSWIPSLAAKMRGAEILQIPRANHGLMIAGDLQATLEVVKRIAARVEALVARL